jgi:GT2 family glycosyltransferase
VVDMGEVAMGDAREVSVVIATCRRENVVPEAIASALSQRDVTVEVIVVDDSGEGSARRSVEGIGDPRVRYVARRESSGRCPAIVRNEGATLASAELVHFLDDDDKLADGALRRLADALIAAPEAGMAFGRVVPFGDDPTVLANRRDYFEAAAREASELGTSKRRFAAQLLFRNTCLVNSACLVRRRVHAKMGGYDPRIPIGEDIEYYLRVGRAHGFVFVDLPVVHYRTGAPSLCNDAARDVQAARRCGYGRMYQTYKQEYGLAEFYGLKLAVRGAGMARRLVAMAR